MKTFKIYCQAQHLKGWLKTMESVIEATEKVQKMNDAEYQAENCALEAEMYD